MGLMLTDVSKSFGSFQAIKDLSPIGQGGRALWLPGRDARGLRMPVSDSARWLHRFSQLSGGRRQPQRLSKKTVLVESWSGS